ncbi:hypothetical protein B9N43_07880 [Denitratisoma sp. DHT3]|uniref:hypothetical protein n=1 Tax=Denitratisoma sp. DHT3 TaxID=1981880 RepID=UPI001198CB55|nr:hypothetical protein [Denitratisoma sp. DHT3]QDX81165.1 hypothetical protein B9N43_07880 [Denitratisoma sp. DHT3]
MKRMPRAAGKAPATRGFALILLLTLLSLAALYLAVETVPLVRLRLAQGDSVQRALSMAKTALIGYAATYRDQHPEQVFGYLPCPDLNDDGYAEGSCGKQNETVAGLLPYKTLRLPEPVDEAGGRLWYIVSGSFKNNPPAAPMNWDTQGAIAVTGPAAAFPATSSPNIIATPDDSDGGAAAVILATGERLPPTPAAGNASACGNLAAFHDICAVEGSTLRLRQETDESPPRPLRLLPLSPREIFTSVTRRRDFGNPLDAAPPGQLNVLIDMAQKAAEARIGADLGSVTGTNGVPTSALPARLEDYAQFPGKWIGDPPASAEMPDAGYAAYWDNWRDQFRYAVCGDLRLTTPCLHVAGEDCRGALLFAGRAPDGAPRTSRQKPPAASTGRSAYLANYFETEGALPLLSAATNRYAGASRYSTTTPAADVGRCLVPGSFVSFAKDIGNFTARTTSSIRPEAAIQVAAATITLGNAAATANGSGCIWYPAALPFRSTLRVYFRFRILDAGEGFVLAVADAARNNLAGALCGDANGAHLGYAGPGIAPPKLGLEIDTRSSSANNDPSSQHMAFVYWGGAADNDDDNTHNAGSAGSGAEPLNPRDLNAKPPGIATVKSSDTHLPYGGTLPLNTDIHVRLDVIKQHTAEPAHSRLTLRGYVATVFGMSAATASYTPTCGTGDFRNLALDLDDLCWQRKSIEQIDIPVDDIPTIGEALAQVIVGFTNAQNAANDSGKQSVVISDFLLYSQ